MPQPWEPEKLIHQRLNLLFIFRGGWRDKTRSTIDVDYKTKRHYPLGGGLKQPENIDGELPGNNLLSNLAANSDSPDSGPAPGLNSSSTISCVCVCVFFFLPFSGVCFSCDSNKTDMTDGKHVFVIKIDGVMSVSFRNWNYNQSIWWSLFVCEFYENEAHGGRNDARKHELN